MFPSFSSTKNNEGDGLTKAPPGWKPQPTIYDVFDDLKAKGATNLKDATITRPTGWIREPDKNLQPVAWQEWYTQQQQKNTQPTNLTPTYLQNASGIPAAQGTAAPGAVQRRMRRSLAIRPNAGQQTAGGGSGTAPAPSPSPTPSPAPAVRPPNSTPPKITTGDRVGINPPTSGFEGPRTLPAYPSGGADLDQNLFNQRRGDAWQAGAGWEPRPTAPPGSNYLHQPQTANTMTAWPQMQQTPSQGTWRVPVRPFDINKTGRSSQAFPWLAQLRQMMPNAQVRSYAPPNQMVAGKNFQSNPAGDRFQQDLDSDRYLRF